MPKRRRQEGKVQHKHKRKPKVGDDVKGAGYTPIVKENARFVKYYQGLGVVPAEEWEDFMSVMRRPLPSTFRITGTRHQATAVRQCLQQTFFTQLAEAMQQGGEEGEELAPPTPFPWYPNNLAWHIPLSKAFIRKSPEVAKFHRFLVDESDQGNISRQEAVSMIPPLLLDVQPHHKVLDMCAAPGSKTAQLIEMIHANDLSSPSVSSLPAGVVVANDADNKRCYMLVHQAKRLKSPCFMVTNHDASVFPMLYYHDENDVRHPLHYDRVVCDVPCSGDGTMRKNPTIWRSWNPALGAALHKLQLRILNRGLELLVPGGRLVYSTCSLNPVENEAVISTMLQLCKGSVELLDVSSQLPGLKTISGMTSWKVMNRKCEWETVDATTAAASTLFPPESSLLPHLNLHRCVRVLPHHQDTGGFFIAVLHKSDWLPWQRRPQQAAANSNAFSSTASAVGMQRLSVLAADTGDSGDSKQEGRREGGGVGDRAGGARSEAEREGGVVGGGGDEQERLETIEPETDASCGQTDSAAESSHGRSEKDRVRVEGSLTESGSETGAVVTGEGGGDGAGVTGEGSGDGGVVTGEGDGDGGVVTGEGGGDSGVVTGDGSGDGGVVTGEGSGDGAGVTGEGSGDGVRCEGGRGGKGELEALLGESNSRPIFGRPGHRQGARGRVYREDPYVFLTGESEVWKLIKPYYGLADTFPYSQLLTRTVTGKKRNIYLTSSLVKELLHRNELHVKFINVGVKVLARCDNYNASCPFRLCQEGIESLVAFITNNRLSLTLDDLVLVLKEPNPLSVQLAQETQDALSSLGVGPALFDYIPSHSKQTASTLYDHPIYLSGWVARKSVRLYVDKKYRCHYLAMLGHEPPLTMSLASVSAGTREGERVEVEEWKMQEEERSGYEGEEREVDQVVVVGTDMIEDISEGCGDKV